MMSTYKLVYNNSRGRAEPIRIMFAQAGVKYEDFRFDHDQWANEYKKKMPFGRAPSLEVDGTLMIAGSLNILRYLGMKFGMAGKDEIANAVLGGGSDYIADIAAGFTKIFLASGEERARIAQEFKEKTAPGMLGTLQKNVNNGHINGSETLSWVDIQCYYLLDNLNRHLSINVGDYPELQKLYDNVASQPNIKNWLETRPKTEH